MAQSNRPLGQSASTAGGRDTAVRLFDYYQTRIVAHGARTLANLTQDDIQGENLDRKFRDFAYWLATTPIPKNPNRDDLLTPRVSDASNPTYLGAMTLTQYLGRVRASLSDRFAGHPFFHNPDDWTALRTDFQTEVKRAQITSSDDFGGNHFRCLYKLNSKDPRLYEFGRDDVLNDWVSKCDLKAILRSLLRKARDGLTIAGPLQRRCWLVTTYHAMGRGGEIKFQSYADWVYDPRFEVTNIHWKELKKLASYAMPMMADMDGYECCFYHALGSFWLVESGLYRRSVESADAQFVFPDLHQTSDAGVARKLTSTIRDNLPAGVPQAIKDSLAVKSLRKASITTLAAHTDLTVFDSVGRSGHSTGTTQDSYIDRNCVAVGLRGGRVLAGAASSRKDVCPPKLEWLGIEAAPSVDLFISALFIVSIADFSPNGPLYGILRIVTAALVMHHKKLSQDFAGTQHVIVDKMVKAARAARVADRRCTTSADPAAVLDFWSDILLTTFNERNMPPPPEPSVAALTATIQEQQAVLQNVLTQLQSVKDEIGSVRRGQQNHGSILEQLKLYFSSFFRTPIGKRKAPPLDLSREQCGPPARRSLVALSGTSLSAPSTPPHGSPEMAGGALAELEDTSAELEDVLAEVDIVVAPAAPDGLALASADSLAAGGLASSSQQGFGSIQVFNSAAVEVAAASDKGLEVQKLLVDMFQAGSFVGCTADTKLQELAIPLYVKDVAKVRSVLELVGFIVKPEERATLSNRESVALSITNICKDLQDRSMQKMLVLEKGQGADVAHTKVKPYVTGLGRRVFNYKKQRNLTTIDQIPGTPPGTRSIHSFFSRRES